LRSQLSGDLRYIVGDENLIDLTHRSTSQSKEKHATD
jgi:hypothetical protein